MNLEQSDSFKSELERNARSKRNVVISLVFCAFLLVLLIVLIAFISYQDSITEKMFIDDAQVPIPAGFYRDIDGVRYVNIKNLAEMFGYTYTEGIYGEYTTDPDSCYLRNDFEVVAITAGSQKYTKYLEYKDGTPKQMAPFTEEVQLKHEKGYSETFDMENTVIYEDELLYVPQEYVASMFNINVDWKEFRIKFYTLNYMIGMAQRAIGEIGLTEIDLYYENLKALNYGYIVVGDSKTGKESRQYGVIELLNPKKDPVVSIQYEDVVFVENSREFYITVPNGTVGILDEKGDPVITPMEFDKISLLDQENKLYLVEKNHEYGVLGRNGKILIHAEYDEIGIDLEDFVKEEVDNGILLFGKCIAVEKDGNYGLYDIEGNRLLETAYDGFGYITPQKTTSSGSRQSALLIPSYVGINGIVVNLDDKYGIFDVNKGELILPTVFDEIYSIKKEGERTYYVSYAGDELELSEFLKERQLNNVNENGEYIADGLVSEPIADETPDVEENVETNESTTSEDM